MKNRDKARLVISCFMILFAMFGAMVLAPYINDTCKTHEPPIGGVACNGAYFTPSRTAVACEVYGSNRAKVFVGFVDPDVTYCGSAAGYVKCVDSAGKPIIVATSGMCPFVGDNPTCAIVPTGTQVEVMGE